MKIKLKQTNDKNSAGGKAMRFFKPFSMVVGIIVFALLAGCASTSLKAPCPEFGKYCSKVPINSWNTRTS